LSKFSENTAIMSDQFFALKLIPSRPDFAQTMNEEEKAIMGQHVEYWKEFMEQGKVVAFGPVLDPAGIYGFGILKVSSASEVDQFIAGDPAGSINKYEYYPMMAITPD